MDEFDSAIEKLIEYGKTKQILSWEEINGMLPPDVLSSDKMENVLALLAKNNIQIEEDTLEDEDDADDDVIEDEDAIDVIEEESADKSDKADTEKKQLMHSDKEVNGDDPVRLYLREIGKENLLTADQEVSLSKEMEEGENIIKDVIKKSGILIPEFYSIGVKAFSRVDVQPGRNRKEINEEMTEKRRLKTCYSEYVKPVFSEMKAYMQIHLIFKYYEIQSLINRELIYRA